jgi:hypothetical protein
VSYTFGTNVECLYNLRAAVTKNTYTTAAPISAQTTSPVQQAAKIPSSFWGDDPVHKGLWVHAQGTIATTSAATFIGQVCLNATAGTLLAAGAVTYWPILAPTAAVTCLFNLDVWYTCIQGGAAAQIQCNGHLEQSIVASGTMSTAPQDVHFQTLLTTLNTQTDMFAELFGTWSVSAAGNTTTLQQFQVFGLN